MMRTSVLLCVICAAAPASADVVGIARRLADDQAFTPGMLRANAGNENGFVVAASNWSTAASNDITLDAIGEVRVWGPVRLIASVSNAFGDTAKPGIGAGVQLLREGRHGLDGTAYARFKTEGFTEPEGELEVAFAMARRFGPVHGGLDVTYGQDPEGNERDGELATAAQLELRPGLFAGAAARYRDALGSTKEAIARDGFGGASTTWTLGPVALTGMAGVAMVETIGAPRKFGPAATLAIGAAF